MLLERYIVSRCVILASLHLKQCNALFLRAVAALHNVTVRYGVMADKQTCTGCRPEQVQLACNACKAVQSSAVQCSPVQSSAVAVQYRCSSEAAHVNRCSPVQSRTGSVQCSPVQSSIGAVQFGTVPWGMSRPALRAVHYRCSPVQSSTGAAHANSWELIGPELGAARKRRPSHLPWSTPPRPAWPA
eukprot:2053434-Pyramimonas_sp.AAC.1